MKDESPLVRSYVASALGQPGSALDRSLLQAAARTERSDHALVGIYEGLWRLSDAEVVHDALRLLNAPDYRVRCAIVNTLVFVFRTSRTKTVVTSALRTRLRTDKARAVRLTIERALKEIGAGR
jgi:HEAT repeat protein